MNVGYVAAAIYVGLVVLLMILTKFDRRILPSKNQFKSSPPDNWWIFMG